MPERTEDGQWRWGNVKRKSKKELAQTVYGIWQQNGAKGSFHDFYYYGKTSGKSKKKNKKNITESKEYSFFNKL